MTTRLFVSADLINGNRVELDGERARYLGRVLRARVGDAIRLFDGSGREWTATIDAFGRDRVALTLGPVSQPATESPLAVHLVQGVSRGERMDFVVQKATELGVRRITPVLTDHSVVKLPRERAARRRAHWQKVAESASEQCGRTQPPRVAAPLPLRLWLGEPQDESTRLLLAPGAAIPLVQRDPPPGGLTLLVGPEGGFSDAEIEAASHAGCEAVSLGPRVLRTESAAIAAIAIVQARWGDLGAAA